MTQISPSRNICEQIVAGMVNKLYTNYVSNKCTQENE